MKQNTLLHASLLAAVVLRMSTATAGTWYGSVGLGDGIIETSASVSWPYNAYYDAPKHHLALKLGFGYDFSKYFAVEGSFQDIFYHSNTFSYGPYKQDLSTDAQMIHALLVGKLPISEKVNLFAKIGPGYERSIWGDYLSQGFSMAAGAGVAVALTDRLGASVEYLGTSGTSTDAFYTNLTWRFK